MASIALAVGPLSREQALQALTDHDPALRRTAVARLGEIGMMTDVPELVKTLRDSDTQMRKVAEDAIEAVWERSGDRMIDALYKRGVEQTNNGDTDAAIETFSLIISKKPYFAEGWNRRATLYYLRNDYTRSLEDIQQVLVREPRHFGALAGLGMIMQELGDDKRALDAFRKALAVNPHLEKVPELVKSLSEKVEGRDI